MKSAYTLKDVSMGPELWMLDWMEEADLAVTTEPDLHWYFFQVPDPVQDEGHFPVVPFPEEYGMQVSVTIPEVVR